MNIEEIREFCLSLPGTTESFPFDDTTLVFKVMGKMFCLVSLEGDFSLNLKNDPEKVVEMREENSSVLPGYHMNKKYWNTVMIDGTIPVKTVKQWITESYKEVVQGLTRKQQSELNKFGKK